MLNATEEYKENIHLTSIGGHWGNQCYRSQVPSQKTGNGLCRHNILSCLPRSLSCTNSLWCSVHSYLTQDLQGSKETA